MPRPGLWRSLESRECVCWRDRVKGVHLLEGSSGEAKVARTQGDFGSLGFRELCRGSGTTRRDLLLRSRWKLSSSSLERNGRCIVACAAGSSGESRCSLWPSTASRELSWMKKGLTDGPTSAMDDFKIWQADFLETIFTSLGCSLGGYDIVSGIIHYNMQLMLDSQNEL